MDTTAVSGNEPSTPIAPAFVYGSGTVPAAEIPTIRLYGAEVLRTPATAVTVFGAEIDVLARYLTAAMDRADGIGLAAPQIGVSARVLVVAGKATNGTSYGYPVTFVNPEVIDMSLDATTALEGCLSFPRIWVQVARPNWIRVRAQRPDGAEFEIKAEGIYARALCHEVAHLDGSLLIDCAKSFQASRIEQKMAKFRRGLTARARGKRR